MDSLRAPVEEPLNLNSNADKKKIKFDDDVQTQTSKPREDISEETMIIATILQYFVTPPYLVKTIFKQKFFKNFRYAKNLPKLSTLPFMATSVHARFREGLTVRMGKISKPLNKSKNHQPLKNTRYVNIGYQKYLELQGQQVPTNVRVTVDTETKKVVSPLEAYKEQVGAKSSYGYHVRIAKTFSSIFTESSYKDGYSQSIYINSGDYFHKDVKLDLPSFELKNGNANLLLLLCKFNDLDYAFQQDRKNLGGIEKVEEFLDSIVEIPEGVRVEDACLIALTKISNS
ncbi:hypothetical protein WICMUC_003116 [Wickerhamomyces mucosus]|uniref:Uncharacterized protein n=1 Tax=Wickerhamomyces mucosus TaxID=1378264 RepID=A0A9P8PNG7_9ASCO|nr:hypothetical protein WICMUC_003116 [Wickerhamomyces mucosus]